MKKSRALGKMAVVVVLFVVSVVAYWRYEKPGEKGPEYRTAPVMRGDIRQLVTASGQVVPVVNVQVGSQISGTIDHIFVDYNSLVTNGQVLAQIDPATYQTALKQAQGELANARASLEFAQINAQRSEDLFQNQLIPKSDYDQTIANLHQAEAVAQIREAMVDKAQVDLSRTTIYSPIDGIVISRDVEVGQTVAASFNTPKLFNIANDLSNMQIHASVSEADIGGVQPGQPVEFTVDAFPSRKFAGAVEQVRNAAETNQNVITYTTVIEVTNPELRLKPGMTANVSITVAERTNVLKMANAALRFRPPESSGQQGPGAAANGFTQARASDRSAGPGPLGAGGGSRGEFSPQRRSGGGATDQRTVYLQAGMGDAGAGPTSPLTPVTVRTGISDGAFTEILEGLKEGDTVVVGMTSPAAAQVPATAAGQNNPFAPPRPPRR